MGFEWLALAAALLWAIASLLSVTPAQHLGSFAYSRWRMGCTAVMLSSMALFTGGWSSVMAEHITPMMFSGLIGIFIGDTALFACLNRMGPRQAGLLFSCHAVFSAILGYFLFSESMTSMELLGSLLVFSGVVSGDLFWPTWTKSECTGNRQRCRLDRHRLRVTGSSVPSARGNYCQTSDANRYRPCRSIRYPYDQRLCGTLPTKSH